MSFSELRVSRGPAWSSSRSVVSISLCQQVRMDTRGYEMEPLSAVSCGSAIVPTVVGWQYVDTGFQNGGRCKGWRTRVGFEPRELAIVYRCIPSYSLRSDCVMPFVDVAVTIAYYIKKLVIIGRGIINVVFGNK